MRYAGLLLVLVSLVYRPRSACADDSPAPRPGCPARGAFDAFVSDPALCVQEYASGLGAARQMAFASNGDLFVNNGKVSVLWDANGDGISDGSERAEFGSAPGLNHGLVFSPDQRFVYASSDRAVFRFAYRPGQRKAAGPAELVIKDIPKNGHSTRTLAFDSRGRLYVSVGSASNVDVEADDLKLRSQIRRYQLPAQLPAGGVPYTRGEIVASGMRNEVGMFIDAQDRVWGVENGVDNLADPRFGGDIHNDNPAEELNLVDGHGSRDYGYPTCFTEYHLAHGLGPGTQWADPNLPRALRRNDEFCRDAQRVHPPLFAMPAHWAPLGVLQYRGDALPYAGDLIIAAHGSWDRQPPVGRLIARAHMAGDAVQSLEALVGEKGKDGQLEEGRWSVRPVDVREGPDGALYVSDDQGGRVLRISRAQGH